MVGHPSAEGGSQGDGKQMFGKQMLAKPTLTMRHREDSDQMDLARFLPVCHNWFMLNYVMVIPYLEQVLYLNSFRQVEGRREVFPEPFFYLKIINISKRHVLG